MEFEKLSKSEKIKYWSEIENDILQCLSLCGDCIPSDIASTVNEYLSHNELGIALEILTDMAVEHEWNISDQAKKYILRTFKKMDYHKTDTEQYESYKKWVNTI